MATGTPMHSVLASSLLKLMRDRTDAYSTLRAESITKLHLCPSRQLFAEGVY
jgi:hypothetical protein